MFLPLMDIIFEPGTIVSIFGVFFHPLMWQPTERLFDCTAGRNSSPKGPVDIDKHKQCDVCYFLVMK